MERLSVARSTFSTIDFAIYREKNENYLPNCLQFKKIIVPLHLAKEALLEENYGTKTIKNRYNYGNEKNLPAFSS